MRFPVGGLSRPIFTSSPLGRPNIASVPAYPDRLFLRTSCTHSHQCVVGNHIQANRSLDRCFSSAGVYFHVRSAYSGFYATSTYLPAESIRRGTGRHFSSFSGSSLKAGMIFLHGDKYCEVISNRQVKQGRGSASIQVEYVELSSKKQMTLNLPIGAKVDKIDVDRQSALVQYLDEDTREIVVSDQNYEDTRIPAGLVGDGAKLLEPGDELQVFYHDRTIVKVGLPNNVQSKLK
ncbi:elongation factor [Babesia ovata]|uniref:Elongation factor n=1 Tax=Babesia ovata TaxID=189622 RepID=A0A2H6KAJ2_9APIC|nr:elongation factor [Babesia ovata]GBE60014.1 elongation factor [Babesia ovata]